MFDLLVKNCGQILTMKGGVKSGKGMMDLGLVENGFLACVKDKIAVVGRMSELKNPKISKEISAKTKVVDAKGCVVMPGLIDCHTHLVFAGNRAHEFKMKLEGKSYLDILADGGGILSTVNATRKANKADLVKNALGHLKDMLEFGITTVEAKSGYGLDLETELKILQVMKDVARRQPIRIIPTFLGAHTVPLEFKDKPREYLKFVMKKVLPKVKGLAQFVDIFCEKRAFDLDQSAMYLKYAKKLGFKLKIHGEQINNLGACLMAAKIGAVSVDHADQMNKSDVKTLAKFVYKNDGLPVVVLLPLVPLFLREDHFADGRAMVDAGLSVAVSTDFNPGSAPSKNLFLAMSLACLKMGLKVEEVLNSVTINAAAALDLNSEIGSLEEGKVADILITGVKNYGEIPYWMGENLVEKVVASGRVVR